MTPEERQMLEGLFDRVKQSSAAPRDREAEDMIHQAVQAQPHAPYLLAQAVIVQEEGLKAAAARIQELEAELAERTREREEVTARITELKDRIARSRRQADDQEMRQRVRFLPGSEYSKAPVFVEATASGLAIAELDQSKTPRLVARLDGPDADARLVGALGRRLPNAWYMVFVVHEDAIPRFETLRNAMIRKGYEVGWQLWQGEPGGLFEGARPVEAVP